MNKLSQNLKDLIRISNLTTLLYLVRKLSSLLPNCTLVDIGKVTARQRMIKSKEEIEVEISLFLPENQIAFANPAICLENSPGVAQCVLI